MPLLKLWNSFRGRSTKGQSTDQGPVAESKRTTSKTRAGRGRGIFGGGPHAGLCKQIKSVDVDSILEISVEDGSRALAVLQAVQKRNENARYIAIDQFEMAGGPVTLKQFHQTLRASGFRPQVFPETMERGLIRVAHTIGTVDLVLIAAAPVTWQTPQLLALLSRVTHQETLVLYREEEETWKKFATQNPQRRAA